MSGRVELDLAEALPLLERTPRVLDAMLRALPSAWTDATEGDATWSPRVVLGHLIHGERTDWIPRARLILAQGPDRRFEPFDRFAQLRSGTERSVGEMLDEFAALRAANLTLLREWRLTATEMALEGEHPELGAVTLEQLLSTWVAHDLGHIAQIARVMAGRYRETVGPWRAYLPILGR